MTVLTPRRDLPLLSPVEPRLWWRQKGRTRLSGGKEKREREEKPIDGHIVL